MFSPLLRTTIAVVALALVAVNASPMEVGKTVNFNGIHYYVPAKVVGLIGLSIVQVSSAPKCPGQPDLIPFTVLTDDSSLLEASLLTRLVENYTVLDDVFNIGFLSSMHDILYFMLTTLTSVAVYFQYTGNGTANISDEASSGFTQFGTKLFILSAGYGGASSAKATLPAGPYFMDTDSGEVYEAWRLYSDVQGAFTEGLIAADAGNYTVLPAAIPGAQSLTIGVPSRLYFTKTAAKPLAGVSGFNQRDSVSDILNRFVLVSRIFMTLPVSGPAVEIVRTTHSILNAMSLLLQSKSLWRLEQLLLGK